MEAEVDWITSPIFVLVSRFASSAVEELVACFRSLWLNRQSSAHCFSPSTKGFTPFGLDLPI